ncbi:MAG TPA: GDP-mannose 4,6-dehydratase [Xanthobacteraceae bacterium]|jgi:GDPmannose 4,6-dehydratase
MPKTALITGVSGQDGAYLSRLLLQKGYRVVGSVRRTAAPRMSRLMELGIENDIEPVELDLTEITNVMRAIEHAKPDEIYNLAAQSFVAVSFEQPILTAEVGALGNARLLEAIRTVDPKIRLYQASSSEMFGKVADRTKLQNENSPFHPRSPYGVSKLFAHWLTVNYRESYGFFAVSGILFNHESPLRGREFVTRKITAGLAEVKHGRREILSLGNLEAQRDWGFAGDFVDGIWRMLQRPAADDYVLATGTTTSVRGFCELAAERLGFAIDWKGKGDGETGIDRKSGKTIIRIDPRYYRPAEVDYLLGDAAKARRELGWSPATTLADLVTMMVEADDLRVRENRLLY